jgi:predicted nucleotidyltransferase
MQVDRRFLDELVRRIREVADPHRIILFGSAADGSLGPDSDIDLLILTDGRFNTWENRVRIRAALRGMGVPVDVAIMTPERFEETRNVIGGLAHPADKHGKVLYAAA